MQGRKVGGLFACRMQIPIMHHPSLHAALSGSEHLPGICPISLPQPATVKDILEEITRRSGQVLPALPDHSPTSIARSSVRLSAYARHTSLEPATICTTQRYFQTEDQAFWPDSIFDAKACPILDRPQHCQALEMRQTDVPQACHHLHKSKMFSRKDPAF